MKKISLILLGFFLIISLSEVINSQTNWWQDNGSHIYNLNSGNVGIGISDPAWKLHVYGDIGSLYGLHWNNGRSHLNTDQGGSIELGDYLPGLQGPGVPITPYIDFHYGSLNPDFNARIINSDDNKLEFKMGNGGNLILNGTPSGSYNIPMLKLISTVSIGNSFEFENVNGVAAFDFWNDGTNAIIDFFADYQNHPEYNQFSVKRDNNFGNTCGWGNDESWLCGDRVYLGAPTQGPSIHLNQTGSNLFTQPYISFAYGNTGNNNRNDIVLKNSGPDQLDILTHPNKFGENGHRIMSIKDDGVYAIKITVQSSWSDFVFKPEFKLKPLAEVEKYINEKGHLEGIPSESEVTENGVDLGDMTSKLLQKIEELTLYVIEQNKEIERLKNSINK